MSDEAAWKCGFEEGKAEQASRDDRKIANLYDQLESTRAGESAALEAVLQRDLELAVMADGLDAAIAHGADHERARIVGVLDLLADKVRGEPHKGAPSFDFDCGDDDCDFSSGECEHAILCALDRLKIEVMKGKP